MSLGFLVHRVFCLSWITVEKRGKWYRTFSGVVYRSELFIRIVQRPDPQCSFNSALVKFLRQFSVIIVLVMRPRVLGRWCDNRSRRGSVGIHWRARWGGGGCTRTRCNLESRLRLHDG